MAIDGTNGNDTLTGDVFADTINGFAGDDIIDGGGSADILNGGSGDDTFRYTNFRHFDAGETINGGTGYDRLLLNAASTFDIRTTHISSIEELEFGVADIAVDLNSSQIGAGLSSIATIDGSGTSAQLIFHVNTPNVDLSNLNFQQWDEADNSVTIYGSVYSEDDPLSWYFWDRALGSGTSITGSTVDDVIYGSEGADIIRGHLGNDNIVASGGLDGLYGGEGDDCFIYNSGWIYLKDEVIDGGAGTDTIRLVYRGEYDFRATTLRSIEEIEFSYYFDKNAIINSSQLGSGLNAYATITAENFNGAYYHPATVNEFHVYVDTASTSLSGLTFQNWMANDRVVVFGTRDADTVLGTSVGDTMYGNRGADVLDGGAGDDLLYGGGGNDIIIGGTGVDTIYGNAGADYLVGHHGDDFIFAGGWSDWVAGGDGNDTIHGGSGNDRLFGGCGNDTILGGAGVDTIDGNFGNDYIVGNGGDDIISAGRGSDGVEGGDGNDTISGGSGVDRLFGEAGNDTIFGGNGRDFIDGGSGNDQIHGNGFADELHGGSGDDSIYGGAGSDIINGGGDSDSLWGGDGRSDDGVTDRFVFESSFGEDRIRDFENGLDKIDFAGNATFNDFATVSANATQSGSDILITQNAGNTLTIEDMNLADLDASDFLF